MELSSDEKNIFEIVKAKISDREMLIKKGELKEIVAVEVKSKMIDLEEWQRHYCVERILSTLEDARVHEEHDNQKRMSQVDITRLQKHQKYFRIFLTLTILGIIEVATHQFINSQYGLSDIGIIAFYVGVIFAYVNASLGAVVMTFLGSVIGLVILWAPIAIIEYRTIKRIKKNRKAKGEDQNIVDIAKDEIGN